MLESFNLNDDLQYQKLSPDEQSSRGILGRLKGVIADFKNPTRNGRKYTEELWEQTFNNPIMLEKINNRCLFGELGHPTDRQEVDMEKIAICMSEIPKKGSDGKLHAVFDILATPCGKILKTLCDYGCNIGISSRGSGDTYTDAYGEEVVDKDTFECECWDAVLVPAVKEARLQYVNESFSGNSGIKTALCEALNQANDVDKKIMEDKLKELNIDYSPAMVNNKQILENKTADNDGETLVEELQTALKEKVELEKKLNSLQEKLSVSYTKEAKMNDQLSKYKVAIKSLTELSNKNKAFESKLSTMSEELKTKDSLIEKQNAKIKRLSESRKETSNNTRALRESVSNREEKIETLQKQVKTLSEGIKSIKSSNELEKKKLIENIEELKADSAIKHSEYKTKLSKANSLVEKYKSIATNSVNKYIESQAIRIGVSSDEIKNRLHEGYTFDDIDTVCEDLQNYRINISKLPFDISKTKNVRMKITESKEPIKPVSRFADDVDEQLMSLAGLQ